ncbi:MAG: hypothetical protein J6A75_13665 [Lachnospiraceae bacterium]|nr:hypothetical protein [Lachnospiraceae bacterium]
MGVHKTLYKARRIDNGEWVKGNLILLDDAVEDFRAIIIPREGSNCISSSIEDYVKFDTFYKVDIDSVCRYTEHNDHEGNEIFENDIIRLYGVTEDDYIVRWLNGTFVLCDIKARYWKECFNLVEDVINEGMVENLKVTVLGNFLDDLEFYWLPEDLEEENVCGADWAWSGPHKSMKEVIVDANKYFERNESINKPSSYSPKITVQMKKGNCVGGTLTMKLKELESYFKEKEE